MGGALCCMHDAGDVREGGQAHTGLEGTVKVLNANC